MHFECPLTFCLWSSSMMKIMRLLLRSKLQLKIYRCTSGTRYMHFQMLMLMHMLVFIHDFLGNMLDDKKWEILGGDTDSVIIALAEKSGDASVLPENGQNLKNSNINFSLTTELQNPLLIVAKSLFCSKMRLLMRSSSLV